MRNEQKVQRVRLASLRELDALIGEKIVEETPHTHWEHAETRFQFESVEAALEALQDPYFKQFLPQEESKAAVLTEVKEFRRYSADLNAAWTLVERLSPKLDALYVKRDDGGWIAAFGSGPGVIAETAPLAICVAALRARDIEVEFRDGPVVKGLSAQVEATRRWAEE